MTMATESIGAGEMSWPRRYDAWKETSGGGHLFDAARALGTDELTLAFHGCGGRSAQRLRPDHAAFYQAMPSLGRVKTMSRNAHAVIEKWGTFQNVEIGDSPLGQVVGPDIDLRLFVRRMGEILFVKEGDGSRWSFQLFDKHGDSGQKIYLEEEDKRARFAALANELAHPDPGEPLAIEPPPTSPQQAPDEEIDVEGFRRAWDAMTNTHEFFLLLRQFGVTRTQALRLAGTDRAREVDKGCLESVLTQASQTALPIMVFIGSRACLQIHTGPVKTIKRMSGYLNVLDKGTNLHIQEAGIARVFVVSKPTDDGIVTSLELFDEAGESIGLLFGERKPGKVELPAWRSMMEALR